MTAITVDLQFVRLSNNSEFIIEVARTLLGTDGVKLLYFNSNNAIFTIETIRDPEEIRDALQHTFPETSVTVSRRINTPNSSIQRPFDVHDVARDMVEGSHGKGLVVVEYKQSTTLKMNFTAQPTTSHSATNVRDSEDGGYGYANASPPPQQYPPTTYGSTSPDGPLPPASAPPMPKTEGDQGHVYGYPIEMKYVEDDYYSAEGFVSGYPSKKKYMEDDYYSGGCSAILLCLFYGILILLLAISIKSERVKE